MQWPQATGLHQCLRQRAAMLSLKRKWTLPNAFDQCSHCRMYVPRNPQVIPITELTWNLTSKRWLYFISCTSLLSRLMSKEISHHPTIDSSSNWRGLWSQAGVFPEPMLLRTFLFTTVFFTPPPGMRVLNPDSSHCVYVLPKYLQYLFQPHQSLFLL